MDQDLRAHLVGMEGRLLDNVAVQIRGSETRMEAKIRESESRMQEQIRDSETKLLTEFWK